MEWREIRIWWRKIKIGLEKSEDIVERNKDESREIMIQQRKMWMRIEK